MQFARVWTITVLAISMALSDSLWPTPGHHVLTLDTIILLPKRSSTLSPLPPPAQPAIFHTFPPFSTLSFATLDYWHKVFEIRHLLCLSAVSQLYLPFTNTYSLTTFIHFSCIFLHRLCVLWLQIAMSSANVTIHQGFLPNFISVALYITTVKNERSLGLKIQIWLTLWDVQISQSATWTNLLPFLNSPK